MTPSQAEIPPFRRGRRGTTTARGLGRHHQRTRADLAGLVATGRCRCARGAGCREAELVDGVLVGGLIRPGEPWDLGHVDGSGRRLYSGPEHRACNRATSRHRARRMSREW
jgi:hypothetical protein